MHDDPDVGVAARGGRPVEPLAEGREGRPALVVVGGIHVDEERLGPGRLDRRLDLLDVGQRGPEVEVDAEDPIAGRGQRPGGRLAHPGRGAEDDGPALAIVGHRVPPRSTVPVGRPSFDRPSLADRDPRAGANACNHAPILPRGGSRPILGRDRSLPAQP